ncbi:MAG TPA: hypothetical protein VN222_03965 [Novosphingobium sp.]|nr:hypothetical protein [Novosphingobium sp.]
MFIPGPRLSTVFASRWKALLWAGGILLSAYLTASEGAGHHEDAQPASAAQTDSGTGTSPWDK